MNMCVRPPFDHDQAMAAVNYAAEVWKSRDLGLIIQLFSHDCVWRDDECHIHGKENLLGLIQKKKSTELHCRLITQLWSHSFRRIVVSFQCEWQHSVHGQWINSSGYIFLQFNASGLIKELCISTNNKDIRSSERTIDENLKLITKTKEQGQSNGI